MAVSPYLFFEGRCKEAIEFYKTVLGAQVEALMHYSESPDPTHCPPGFDIEKMKNKVMHAQFQIDGTTIMASDGMCSERQNFQGFSLSLSARDEAHARLLFDALGQGGDVQMPLGKTFFSPAFGMVADRFGISWMVITNPC